MLNPSAIHPYQKKAINHIIAHEASMVWLGLGLGKTMVTLTAINHLMNTGFVYGTLVLGPLRVVQTVWEKEIASWSHLHHMTSAVVHGTDRHKKEMINPRRPSNIYLLNYEGIPWFVEWILKYYVHYGRSLPFNMIVMDESTATKSYKLREGSMRMRELSRLFPYVRRRVSLTGTPCPNGLVDVFGQFLALDDGATLGTSRSEFLGNYFRSTGYGGYTQVPTELGKEMIHRRIGPITLEMSAADYLDLPQVTFNDIVIDLPPGVREQYDTLERDAFLEFDSGVEIDPANRAVLTNKCLQLCNGSMYANEDRTEWEDVHKLKLDALSEVLEEMSGEPLLIGYQFRFDAERIKKLLKKKKIKFVHLGGPMKTNEINSIIEQWNNKELAVILGHPKSIGHGLNLQYGCHNAVWYGLPWSSELYDQFNGRIDRQGQKFPVIIHRLLIQDTMDFATLEAQERKAQTQNDLRAAVNAYRLTKGL